MESARLEDLYAFFAYVKVFSQSFQKLLFCQTVEVLHHAVVVNDLELAVRECDSHEVVVFFLTGVLRILTSQFSTDTCGCCCTMVAVCYIECRNLSKDLSDTVDVSLLADYPEMMAETVFCHKIIFRLLRNVACYNGIYLVIVRV